MPNKKVRAKSVKVSTRQPRKKESSKMCHLRFELRIFNAGGIPDGLVNFQLTALKHMAEVGVIKPEDVKKEEERLKQASRPVKEQCRFEKTIPLPFIPYPGMGIKEGDFVIPVSQLSYDPKKGQLTSKVDWTLCGDPNCTSCGEGLLKHLMQEESGWVMFMPETAVPPPQKESSKN